MFSLELFWALSDIRLVRANTIPYFGTGWQALGQGWEGQLDEWTEWNLEFVLNIWSGRVSNLPIVTSLGQPIHRMVQWCYICGCYYSCHVYFWWFSIETRCCMVQSATNGRCRKEEITHG